MNNKKNKKSKKRFFPNALTILNMFLGFTSILFIMRGEYINAGILILLAGLMDIFDGKIARLLGISSKFGVEFDSLADTVSFCVAPSILIYSLYSNNLHFILGLIISFIPLICGTVRLAKYNLETDEDSHKSYFIGLSTPISTVTILAFMYFNNQIGGGEFYGNPNIALGLVIFLGILMLSPIHFPKVPLITFKSSSENSKLLIILIVCSFSIMIWKGFALLPICLGYIIANTFLWFFKIRPGNI
ncbi:MAG: CDP-diacylglycerol--serine O-phosphatidyltransferase [bacterium TMED217]|nr:MAG: CDP-diacylglycerol--serine O-phosphatidyltransferase [bacterium TMED217]|tara:strand:+ start:1822 stop:2556 length:735 start_codon:yes stop_codon:yes gene_type:complete